jgi:CheY-like chemotaxis protein
VSRPDNPPVGTILFVDENEESLIRGASLLGRSGNVVVETARSGIPALGKLREKRYDVVISAYTLFPGTMNGIGLLTCIRREFGHIPFILCERELTKERMNEACGCGADFCVTMEGDQSTRFALLEGMIISLIERFGERVDPGELRERESRSGELFFTGKERSLLMMITPGGGLKITLNGASLHYIRKTPPGDFYPGYAEFMERQACELMRISDSLARIRIREYRRAEREHRTKKMRSPAYPRQRLIPEMS